MLVVLMGAIGGAMAAALLFNTASAGLGERAIELGSLQAAGMGARLLARLVAVENLLLTMGALVPGRMVRLVAVSRKAGSPLPRFPFLARIVVKLVSS